MKNITLILILFLILPSIGFSQADKPANWCASEYPADMIPFLERTSQDISDGTYRSGSNYVLPMTIHVLRNTDGSGGVTETSVHDVFCGTSEKYAEYGIDIYLRSIEYHNSSNFNSDSNLASTIDLLYSVDGTINVFVHSAVSGEELCGVYKGSAISQQSTGSPDLIQVSAVCWSPPTLIHEIGHYFGLPHTFFGFEGSGLNCASQVSSGEEVDGSNCTTTGDRICDTPPDYSSDRWTCNPDSEGCIQIDPNGVEFRPDGTNYMSYSDDNCVNKFTPMQVAVMKSLVDNLRQDLYNFTPPSELGDITGTAETYLPPNGSTRAYDEVYFNWTPVGQATAYLFEISKAPVFNPSFVVETVTTTSNQHTSYVLQANFTYHWRVKPYNPGYTCAPYSATGNFTTAEWTVANEEVEGLEDFVVFPNPIIGGQSVNIELQSNRNMEGVLNLYNVQGQRVYTENITVTASANRFAIDTEKLPTGMYVVNVDFENGSVQQKLIIGQ